MSGLIQTCGVTSLVILTAAMAGGDVSDQGISYQGRLVQNGTPVTGTADVEFRLFDVESGGVALQVIPIFGLAPNKGLFSVALDFDPAWFDGSDLWLELAVRSPAGTGSYVTVSPRQAVRATAYSLFAANNSGWQVQDDGTISYLAGSVGIGLDNPGAPLHLHGGGDLRLLISGSGPSSGQSVQFSDDSGNWFIGNRSVAPNSDGFGIGRSVLKNDVVVDMQGRVGIGTTSPTASLHVIDADGSGIQLERDGNIANMYWSNFSDFGIGPTSNQDFRIVTGNAFRVTVKGKAGGNQGYVGIGTNTPTEVLHVVGNVKADDFKTTSDARVKWNIKSLEDALAIVSQLRGVSYRWKDSSAASGHNDRTHLGFIAQEIEAVLPEVVTLGSDGYYTVSYMEIVPVLAEAIKELNQNMRGKDAVIEMQAKRIDDLELRLERLEKLMSDEGGE